MGCSEVLVKVARLRLKGDKLAADQVRAAGWLRGQIRVTPEPERRMTRHKLVAILMASDDAIEPIAQLFGARLAKMEVRGFILTGVEEIWVRKQGIEYPQSWWCVPFTPHPPCPPSKARIDDQREEAEQIAQASHAWTG